MKKPRHDLYLDEELSRRLNALAAKPGSSKSAILGAALKSYLDSQGADRVDDLLRNRLNGFGNRLDRIERDQKVVLETLTAYLRHHFLVTAPPPDSELAGRRAQAEARFEAFIQQVGRRLAAGRSPAPHVAPPILEAAQ